MTLVYLRPELLSWLRYALPDLPANVDLRFVDTLPLWPFTRNADGLTLGRTVYLRTRYQQQLADLAPNAIQLLCHELCHVQQFAASRFWPLLYACQHVQLEAAAYQRALELRLMWEASR